jgi:ribonuclease P protein component
MLSLNNRLKKTADIRNVFKQGRLFKEGFLIFKTVKNDLDKSRFGFIVSQKVSKQAVIRNKIKRRLRGAVIKRIKEIKTGTDNLFIALPGLAKKDFLSTEQTANSLLKKADMFSDEK